MGTQNNYDNLPEGEDHDDGVREVEESGHELVNLQLCHKVEEAVGRHIHRRASRHDKGSGTGKNIFFYISCTAEFNSKKRARAMIRAMIRARISNIDSSKRSES